MELTYLYHSGFALETNGCILVFDYWMDPTDVMSRMLMSTKPLYVFSSHFHEDHFTTKIFSWRKNKTNIKYILSKDILKHRRANKDDADVWLAKGLSWEDDHLKVFATGSNDSGVSWIVKVEGKTIFHAGDLCNWYARFLDEKYIPEIVINDKGKPINPIAEEKRFLGELKDIRKITDTFDIALFPIDGRIGNGYTLGARQFIEHFNVGMLVPMHFIMSGFDSAWRMEPFCKARNIPFWCIHKEGESISFIV